MFHPYSYEGYINFDKVKDPEERAAYEVHIREFGQTPRQIFTKLHPKKGARTGSFKSNRKTNDFEQMMYMQNPNEK